MCLGAQGEVGILCVCLQVQSARSVLLLFLLTCHFSHHTSTIYILTSLVLHYLKKLATSRPSDASYSSPTFIGPVPTNENRFQYLRKVGVVAWVLRERQNP